LQGVLLNTVFYSEIDQDEWVNFVFDGQGVAYERRAAMIHAGFGDVDIAPSVRLGSLSFSDDKELLPLQAADILAWHIRRHADDTLNGTRKDRPIADALWKRPVPTRVWWPQEISDFVDFYQTYHPLSPVNRPDFHRRANAK
jgi:hypothetical protein